MAKRPAAGDLLEIIVPDGLYSLQHLGRHLRTWYGSAHGRSLSGELPTW